MKLRSGRIIGSRQISSCFNQIFIRAKRFVKSSQSTETKKASPVYPRVCTPGDSCVECSKKFAYIETKREKSQEEYEDEEELSSIYGGDKKAYCIATIEQYQDLFSRLTTQDAKINTLQRLFQFIITNFEFISSPAFDPTTRFRRSILNMIPDWKTAKIDPSYTKIYSSLMDSLNILERKYLEN